MSPRFYTPNAEFSVGNRVFLSAKARHHAGRVLRMVSGETAVLFDGRGQGGSGPIHFEGSDAYIEVERLEEGCAESPVGITLVQALVSPDKTDWIVEKAVETGVRAIVFTPSTRSVTKLSGDRVQKRLMHCEEIAASACEQCGRFWIPEIRFAGDITQALTGVKSEAKYLLAPGANAAPRLSNLASVAFAVGAEGGFSPEEIALGESFGWSPTLLGPRVLRTETAGIVAATLANAAAGDTAFY